MTNNMLRIKPNGKLPTNFAEHNKCDKFASRFDRLIRLVLEFDRIIHVMIYYGENGLRKLFAYGKISESPHKRSAKHHYDPEEVVRILRVRCPKFTPKMEPGVRAAVKLHNLLDKVGDIRTAVKIYKHTWARALSAPHPSLRAQGVCKFTPPAKATPKTPNPVLAYYLAKIEEREKPLEM